MMAAHCSVDMALVPESVRRSIRMWRAAMRKRLYPACSRKPWRWAGVVWCRGSTLLMRKGSMMVFTEGDYRTALSEGEDSTRRHGEAEKIMGDAARFLAGARNSRELRES